MASTGKQKSSIRATIECFKDALFSNTIQKPTNVYKKKDKQ